MTYRSNEYKLPSAESVSITVGTQPGKGAGSQQVPNLRSTSGVPAPEIPVPPPAPARTYQGPDLDIYYAVVLAAFAALVNNEELLKQAHSIGKEYMELRKGH